jgi:predicted RNA-binding Zn-ribbon protein involved in translation (DUF1610 family)
MLTTNTTGWWSCAGCGVDVELVDLEPTGCEVPCPDCGEAMIEWCSWENAA